MRQARFGDDDVASGAFCALRMAGHRVARERHNRNVLCQVVGLQSPGGFPSVDERHGEIHQDQIRLQLLGLVYGFDAVLRLGNPETAELQVLAVHFPRVREIVDHQHARFVFFWHARLLRWAHFLSTVGSVSVNVDPLPSLLSTFSVPRSIDANLRQMDKPRPVPPYTLRGLLSNWRKSSKIFW